MVVVTALVGDGTPAERVVHLEVGFADAERKGMPRVRVRLADDGLHAEAL
jgi:hypothetical protein